MTRDTVPATSVTTQCATPGCTQGFEVTGTPQGMAGLDPAAVTCGMEDVCARGEA